MLPVVLAQLLSQCPSRWGKWLKLNTEDTSPHLVPHVDEVPLLMDLASVDLRIGRTCERSRGHAGLVETPLASLHRDG